MGKKIYFILLFITSVNCLAPAEEPVYFADANLKAAVERQLGFSDPTKIDMLALTVLRAQERGISDLSGLEFAMNLEQLFLDNNHISDISVLAGLTNLKHLQISHNQLKNISALADLKNLTKLYLYENQIRDLSALIALKNLKDLQLSQNQISDISALAGLTNLRYLDLCNNRISDISVLSGLKNLTNLSLDGNQISDISLLSGLIRLQRLNLSYNLISDISPLSELKNLHELSLKENRVSDISPLSDIMSLLRLYLSGNQISDISPLSGLVILQQLMLDRNQISDISSLSGLFSLHALTLKSNPISDISVLSGLTNLQILWLINNQISDISPLSGLTNLQILLLSGNKIKDLSPLSELTNLITLGLEYNQISDLAPLSGIRSLEFLGLDGNQISDLSALAGLTNLMGLNLWGNQINDISALIELKNLNSLGLGANPLNYDSCYIYIPLIRENNPGIHIHYDPCMTPRFYVDDDSPNDPVPYDSACSDPSEDGSYQHPFDMIQEAIDLAFSGAIVIVRDGIYKETIDFAGKKITVTSFDPDEPNAVGPYPVLDAHYSGTAVVFGEEEEPNCTLEGFIITRGMGDIAGAISCVSSSPTISNCLIVGNRAMDPNGGGGAVFCMDSNAIFRNCTFSGNYGGPQGAGLLINDSNVAIVNSILWDNYAEVSVDSGSLPSITYSDIQGGWPGTGNMDEPPLLAEPGYWAVIDAPNIHVEPSNMNAVWIDGDYHLLSRRGRYWPEHDLWVLDKVTSPCVDAGDPNVSPLDEPLPNGGRINMGAYGGTPYASMSKPREKPVYFADVNLKAAVERQLGISEPTPTDMLALDILRAYGREITDLAGLEYAKNLRELVLHSNQISDISALAHLT